MEKAYEATAFCGTLFFVPMRCFGVERSACLGLCLAVSGPFSFSKWTLCCRVAECMCINDGVLT